MNVAANYSHNCSSQPVGERRWWYYLVVNVCLYLIGLGLSTVFFYAKRRLRKNNRIRVNSRHVAIRDRSANTVGDFLRQMLLGDNLLSKWFISQNLFCNIVYIILGIIRTYNPRCAEDVFSLKSHSQYILEMIVSIELVMYAVVRFIACKNIVLYWFDMHTIVDVLTLPNVFMSAILGVDWIGLRLLRFVWLTQLITVIRFIPFMSQDAMNIVSLLVYFIILWLASSGIIHLLETEGDPWKDFKNGSMKSFFVYTYLILATISTVGYGDLKPETASGRIFMTFFIIVGLTFFAAIVPRLADITTTYYNRSRYASFERARVPRHVIVCGHITTITAEDFLKDFLHPDRGDSRTHILFLHKGKPSARLERVLRLNHTRVQYLDGSVLNSCDLKKAKIKDSLAIFILANKHTFYPTEEDHSNLFRLVSIKNTTVAVPVIIQLLHSFSKKQVNNIEGWNRDRDVAICLNELKLGILSRSCLCPGFSTLIANLFYTADYSAHQVSISEADDGSTWKSKYIKGSSKEIYSSQFSGYFLKQSFHQAAGICFTNFSLMLIALEFNGKVYVNPSIDIFPHLCIERSTVGYFIAENQDQVRVVESFYHENGFTKFQTSRHSKLEDHDKVNLIQSYSVEQDSDDDSSECGDSREGKRFHIYVSEPSRLEKAILNPDIAFESTAARPNVDIKDHIILCMFADENSPLLGLHSFLKPLRSTKLPPELVKPIVIVSNKEFVQKEWAIIRNIPQVYVVVGNPLRWKNLTSAKVSKSSVCVMLTVPAGSMEYEQGVIDKEAILCTLGIKNAKQINKCEKDVQVITDLHQETNVQFLDFNDEDEPDERIYKAQPFACGEAFSASMFDSVTSSAFHSPGIMKLLESLIQVSETNCLCQAVPISESGFCKKTFREFYQVQLKNNSICLGISRRLNPDSSQRYVITSPEPQLILQEGDFAFVISE